MKREKKPSPVELPLAFEIDLEPVKETWTGRGGIPLVVETYRGLGIGASVNRNVKIKQRQRGFDEGTYVESFVILHAAGGECLDDFDYLREDGGLSELLGHELPSSAAARKFLYEFHEEERIEQAQQQLLPGEIAYIPGESAALHGLAEVNRDLVQGVGQRCPDQRIATIDLDSTIVESSKREALPTYKGGRGYQPMLAVWAETDLIVADEFRDGNVPAIMKPLTVAKRAFACLPSTVEEFYFRGDSACQENELIDWLKDEEREGGPRGFIGFAISARMTPALREAIKSGVAEKSWERIRDRDDSVIRECADVVYVSNHEALTKEGKPLRYIAIRMRKMQGELFGDGSSVKHFAIVTNIWDWESEKLLNWQREKAGTIEAVHDVLKNELGAGVMPCGRFGANAAWLRLAVITHNVLTALKRLVLPPDLLTARPKRLRFLIFNTAGQVLHHARKMILRLATTKERLINYWAASLRTKMPAPA
ncbi:MAG: IS1380 family transposase [Acidobacteriota bacterium]